MAWISTLFLEITRGTCIGTPLKLMLACSGLVKLGFTSSGTLNTIRFQVEVIVISCSVYGLPNYDVLVDGDPGGSSLG